MATAMAGEKKGKTVRIQSGVRGKAPAGVAETSRQVDAGDGAVASAVEGGSREVEEERVEETPMPLQGEKEHVVEGYGGTDEDLYSIVPDTQTVVEREEKGTESPEGMRGKEQEGRIVLIVLAGE
ncbi:hypothetical protein QQ045_032029 [Rhodiola kirilowii]